MNKKEVKPNIFVIGIGGLFLIYLLLIGITILLSRTFMSEMLRNGTIPETGSLIVFFSIPAVLLVFFAVMLAGIAKDFFSNRPGSRFQIKLLANFILLAVFAASPMVIITNLSIGEVLRFWRTLKVSTAMESAQHFALETYTLNMEKLENLAANGVFTVPVESGFDGMPKEVLAVQDFLSDGNFWQPYHFAGEEKLRLEAPPALQTGVVLRELPRDSGVARFVMRIPADRTGPGFLRVISWDLGDDFDSSLEIIADEQEHFELIDSIRFNLTRLLVFYYGLFFLPTLIMTFIIAVSFTRGVSSPISGLSEAISRVASGDFSVRYLPRSRDELTQLARSFNVMVENLERTQTALLKAEKISAWQSLAQQLAHEIKNPLTPIRLQAERILRRWQNEPERIGEILEDSMVSIIQEAEGISTLLTEFRTLSKPSEPSQTWTDVRELIEEITGNYRASHPDVRFNIEHTESGLSLKIDKIKLYQVLSNLFINSIDAMDGKGSIEIRTDIVKKKESGYCRLSVQDSGTGISGEAAAKLFVPYFTTKGSGTGLGLPIVERIINDHGGTIWFNSATGAGTTFFIDLPLEGKVS